VPYIKGLAHTHSLHGSLGENLSPSKMEKLYDLRARGQRVGQKLGSHLALWVVLLGVFTVDVSKGLDLRSLEGYGVTAPDDT